MVIKIDLTRLEAMEMLGAVRLYLVSMEDEPDQISATDRAAINRGINKIKEAIVKDGEEAQWLKS